jgi:hypothetical protein
MARIRVSEKQPIYLVGSESFTRHLYLALGMRNKTAERAIQYSRQLAGEPSVAREKGRSGRPRAPKRKEQAAWETRRADGK